MSSKRSSRGPGLSPSESIDWDLGHAPKQSITEVLQDPRAPTLELPDISNIDLSSSSLTLTPTTPTNLPPPLNINHFESYLRQYAPLHAAYNRDVHPHLSNTSSLPQANNTAKTNPTALFFRQSTALESQPDGKDPKANAIPAHFFDPNFDISAHISIPDTSSSSSDSIPSHIPNHATERSTRDSTTDSVEPATPTLSQNVEVQSLRRELSSYKESLQAQLTTILQSQSSELRSALTDMRDLRTRIETTSKTLRTTRETASLLPDILIPPLSRARSLSMAKRNVGALRSAISHASDAVHAPSDVSDLLAAGAYSAALQRVAAAREILAIPELEAVAALRPVRKQLAQAAEATDGALRQQFRVALVELDQNTLTGVVALVKPTGRLPLLRRVFVKEICDGLSDDLGTCSDLQNARKFIRIAIERAVLLLKIIHQDSNVNGSQSGSDVESTHPQTNGGPTNVTKSTTPANLTPVSNDSMSDISVHDDLATMHTEFEELIARFVDRMLGSFDVVTFSEPTSEDHTHINGDKNVTNSNFVNDTESSKPNSDTRRLKQKGFVILTKESAVSERSCFDELKAALKLGEELKALEEVVGELDQAFRRTDKAANAGNRKSTVEKRKGGSPLRAKLSEKLMAFVTSFHRAHIDAITSAVRADKWQEVSTSPGTVRLLMAVIPETKMHTPSPTDKDKAPFVIADEAYRSVSCGSRFIRSAACYALLAEQAVHPGLSVEIARRGVEVFRVFNSLVCKAILGVAALQWSGLRSITARHLSLASRTIALALYVCRAIQKMLQRTLEQSSSPPSSSSSPSSLLAITKPLMNACEHDLDQHHGQLLDKIVEVMLDRLRAHESALKGLPWDKQLEMKRFDVPSAYILTLVKETSVLHRILWYVLPKSQTQSVFTGVWRKYASALEDAYAQLDGGQDWIRDRVADDVNCVYVAFRKLDIARYAPSSFKPIAQLYNRFASEVIEEREEAKKTAAATTATATATATANSVQRSNTITTTKTTLSVLQNHVATTQPVTDDPVAAKPIIAPTSSQSAPSTSTPASSSSSTSTNVPIHEVKNGPAVTHSDQSEVPANSDNMNHAETTTGRRPVDIVDEAPDIVTDKVDSSPVPEHRDTLHNSEKQTGIEQMSIGPPKPTPSSERALDIDVVDRGVASDVQSTESPKTGEIESTALQAKNTSAMDEKDVTLERGSKAESAASELNRLAENSTKNEDNRSNSPEVPKTTQSNE